MSLSVLCVEWGIKIHSLTRHCLALLLVFVAATTAVDILRPLCNGHPDKPVSDFFSKCQSSFTVLVCDYLPSYFVCVVTLTLASHWIAMACNFCTRCTGSGKSLKSLRDHLSGCIKLRCCVHNARVRELVCYALILSGIGGESFCYMRQLRGFAARARRLPTA